MFPAMSFEMSKVAFDELSPYAWLEVEDLQDKKKTQVPESPNGDEQPR